MSILTFEKTEGAIKNKSRDTVNTGHNTQHEENENNNIENYKDEKHGIHRKIGDKPQCSRSVSGSCLF